MFTFLATQCPDNKIYHQCGSFCPETCVDTVTTCYSGCAEGCFCPDGYVTDNNGRCSSSCPG